MPEIGQTFSHYTIVEKLGAGGMGEVYKARDTRLDRTVALKVLKSAAAPSADLRQRFEREAKAIAALNHPHICTLHDIGREGDTDFLVMECCEGETLAQRLAKGPLPMDQVLRYGAEIAGALDKAHRAGIVHRDLKPGNIMITKAGVKLLDFGLAKLRQPAAATGELLTKATATEPLTATGTILGTLHYMAPEQLEGKDADARADIFALGTVLYEMVTGRKAFEGSSAASVISAVMSATPKAIASLQPLAPPALEHIVTGCLVKDPEDRRQSAADIARDLCWIAERRPELAAYTSAGTPPRTFGILIRAAALAIPAMLIGGVLTYLLLKPPSTPKEPQYFTLQLPVDAPLAQPKDLYNGLGWPALAISPDGRRFAYVAVNKGARILYVRQIDQADFRPLRGTEGAVSPFFSPDGDGLAFWSDGRIKRVAFSGGTVSDVCAQDQPTGGTWDRNGSILFWRNRSLWSVPLEKGIPEIKFTPKIASDETSFPRLQADGKTVLGTGYGDSKLISLPSGAVQTIFAMGSNPYVTSTGHLVAAGAGVLLAAPFDTKTNRAGDSQKVLDDLRTTTTHGVQYALSDSGSLLYAAGGATDEGKLVKVDVRGNSQDLRAKPGIFHHVAMSPKEEKVAVLMQVGGKSPVYVIDLRRPELLKPLSREGTVNLSPVWNPQGDKIAFCSDPGNVSKLWVHEVEGGAAATPVQDGLDTPTDWSRDGHLISYGPGLKSYAVLKMLKMGDTQQPDVLLDSGGDTYGARLSPDMRWLVFVSRKSGNAQIYISPWPVTSSEEIQISTQGGSDPFWSKNGKEVFYRNGYQFMRVSIPESTTSWIPEPKLMFTGNYLNCNNTSWDIMPDGQHFIMIEQTHPDPPKTELHLIQNWFEELKRRVPIK